MNSKTTQKPDLKEDKDQQIGLIFDLDGTILDSINMVSDYFYDVFPSRFNVEWNEEIANEIESYVLGMIQGKSSSRLVIKAINYVADYFGFSFSKKWRFIFDLGKHYKNHINIIPLFPGAYESVKKLSEMPNITTCMNTSGSAKELKQRFKNRENLLDMFNGPIITRSHVKNLKPHPESILTIQKKTGIPLSNLVMIGDMEIDLMAGKNTGVYTIGVLTGHLKREQIVKYNPDFIFEDVNELAEKIEEVIQYMKNNPPKPSPEM